MSENRKLLKIVSLIQAPLGLALIILGVLALAGGVGMAADPQMLGNPVEASVFRLISGIGALVAGLLALAATVLGIRGSNRPRALGSHRTLALLSTILSVLLVILAATGALVITVLAAVACILGIASFIYDGRVRHELDR